MAYNMADLERELSELGWTINAQDLVILECTSTSG